MEANIEGKFFKINLYNTDFNDSHGTHRMDGIEMCITDLSIYLYLEDVRHLIMALENVLEDALDSRRRFKISDPPPEDLAKLSLEDVSDLYLKYLEKKEKELGNLFRSGEWFEISLSVHGVADTWGTAEDIYVKYMPFLVWNSESNRPEFVDETWRTSGIHHDISWLPKYTKMKGII